MVDDYNQRVAQNDIDLPLDEISGYTINNLENNILPHSYTRGSLLNELKSNKPLGFTDTQLESYFQYFK